MILAKMGADADVPPTPRVLLRYTVARLRPRADTSGNARPEELKTDSPYFGAYFCRYFFTAVDCQDGCGKILEKPPPE
jgi:hypothetical protein